MKEQLTQSEEPKLALANSIKIIEEKLKKNARLAHKSGSCATIALISGQNCWVANVGDSRMLSITKDSQTFQVTKDHKPE